MTVDDFSRLIQNPQDVQAVHEADLKEIVDYYPYFFHAKLLYLKSLKESDSLFFESRIASTALYASDKENMFFYLYPEKQLSKAPESYQREERYSGSYFDILDIAEEKGSESPISLKKIAEQLKASRQLVEEEQTPPIKPKKTSDKLLDETQKSVQSEDAIEDLLNKDLEVKFPLIEVLSSEEEKSKLEEFLKSKEDKPYIPVPDYFKEEDPTKKMDLEEKSKWFIKHKKYPEAIKTLKQLYLINPEKSVYFADQIRFLERIIEKTT